MKFFKPRFWDKKQISFFSIILFPLSLLIQLLNFLKSITIKRKSFPIPVICIGNIYVGGTGKTPLCIELYNILKKLEKNPVFIRKKHKKYEDEKKLLEQFGQVYENSNRINSLDNAIKNKFDIAVMDDGFQDHSVKKDFSIICFNEKQWIGNGLTIPSGPLREKLTSLNRANCVVINGKKNNNLENKILEKNKLIKIYYTQYIPENISNFKNRKIICFAGIGNPENFFDMLKMNEINILDQIKFPDHYNYSQKELEDLKKKAKENNAILLTTEKDYLRINKEHRDKINYLKLMVEMEKKNEFIEQIKKLYENR